MQKKKGTSYSAAAFLQLCPAEKTVENWADPHLASQTRSHSAALLSDTDPFRLTDSELEPDLPSPSPSHKQVTLLTPTPNSDPHLLLSRSASSSSSSTSTLDLLSPSPTSALSTPTLVSRPHSPSPSPSRSPPSAEEERLGGWHLINQKLGSSEEEGKGKSRKALNEDDWEALEESVDWGKAPSSKVGAGGAQMVSL